MVTDFQCDGKPLQDYHWITYLSKAPGTDCELTVGGNARVANYIRSDSSSALNKLKNPVAKIVAPPAPA